MKIFKTLPGLMLALIFLIAPGCGSSIFDSLEDKETDEALAFEVSKRLDEGDYNYILSLGEDANPIDYAAAALGAAGIDIGTMVSGLVEATDSASIDFLFAMASGTDSLDELQDAQKYLEAALLEDPDNTALNLQLTLVSLANVTTSISQIADNNDLAGVDTSDGLDETELSILGTAIGDEGTDTLVDTDGDGVGDTELVEIVTGGIDGVNTSLSGSGLDESGTMSATLSDSTAAMSDEGGTVTNATIALFLSGS